MKFAVHPLMLVAFAVPFMMGLIPKLYVFILLLTRGVDKERQLEKQREEAMGKRERLKIRMIRMRRNLLALNIHGPIKPLDLPLDLDRLSQSARSAPSSPRGPRSPRRMGQNLERSRSRFDGDKHKFFASSKFAGCLREEECDQLFSLSTWRTVEAGTLHPPSVPSI